jgi:hypothetical protein
MSTHSDAGTELSDIKGDTSSQLEPTTVTVAAGTVAVAVGPSPGSLDGNDLEANDDNIVDFENHLRSSFNTFDITNEGQLGVTQCFAIINLHLKGSEVCDLGLFSLVFDEFDTSRSFSVDCDTFISIFHTTRDRMDNNISAKPRSRTTLYAFACIALWPFFMLLAYPGRTNSDGNDTLSRWVYKNTIKMYYLPYKLRIFLTETTLGFWIAYIGGSIVFFMAWAGSLTGLLLATKSYQVHVSTVETVVPMALQVFNSLTMAMLMNIDDRPNIIEQRRNLRTCALSDMPFRIRATSATPETTVSAETVLAHVVHQSADGRTDEIKQHRYIYGGALFVSFAFASMPFFARLYHRFNWWGSCQTLSPTLSQCTSTDNDVWRWLAVQSALLLPAFAYWFTSTLANTYFIFKEQLKFNSRMSGILHKESSAEIQAPLIELDYPENVVAWSALRHYLDNFKRASVRSVEIVVGGAAFLMLCLLALVF